LLDVHRYIVVRQLEILATVHGDARTGEDDFGMYLCFG
jgi:hypothetical protein